MSGEKQKYKLIGTVSKELGIDQSTLRYWETKFPIAKPQFQDKKRIYDQEIITLLKGIHFLITKKGYTTKKVQRLIEEKGRDYIIEVAELPLFQKSVPEENTAKNQVKSLLFDNTPTQDPQPAEESLSARKTLDFSTFSRILNSASFGISLNLPENGMAPVDTSNKDKLEEVYKKLENIKSRMA